MSRLDKSMEILERALREAAEAAADERGDGVASCGPVRLVYQFTRPERVDASALRGGEFIAADVIFVAAPECDRVYRVRIVERVTRERSDLGQVVDVAGVVVGRVVSIVGESVKWSLFDDGALAQGVAL